MYKMIPQNGWKESIVRLMKNPASENEYLCIDGMHRIEAMKRMKVQDPKYSNFKINGMIYPHFSEYQQCMLADSNLFCLIFQCGMK